MNVILHIMKGRLHVLWLLDAGSNHNGDIFSRVRVFCRWALRSCAGQLRSCPAQLRACAAKKERVLVNWSCAGQWVKNGIYKSASPPTPRLSVQFHSRGMHQWKYKFKKMASFFGKTKQGKFCPCDLFCSLFFKEAFSLVSFCYLFFTFCSNKNLVRTRYSVWLSKFKNSKRLTDIIWWFWKTKVPS